VAFTPRAGEPRFLDPAIIARIGTMELKARTIVEGFLAGLHRSPFKGFSVEFAEYRQYIPGDDLSTIDWKIYARSDRYYVKKYEEETNLDCHLLVDVSASMGYGSSGVTKLEYGSYLAASLAFLMNRQRDAVGLIAFDERIVSSLPASARPGHLRTVLLALEQLAAGRQSDVSKPLHQLADALVKRSMAVLISDLLDDPERVVRGLKHLRFRGTDVVVFHVLDKDELTFPFDRATRFRDLETGDEVLAVPSLVRDQYLQQVRDVVAYYERELRVAGIDYVLTDTSRPLDFALMSYLSTRAKRG
jgi:uncharacterized protein (DUF58 family)